MDLVVGFHIAKLEALQFLILRRDHTAGACRVSNPFDDVRVTRCLKVRLSSRTPPLNQLTDLASDCHD